jgi:hypothetical protein
MHVRTVSPMLTIAVHKMQEWIGKISVAAMIHNHDLVWADFVALFMHPLQYMTPDGRKVSVRFMIAAVMSDEQALQMLANIVTGSGKFACSQCYAQRDHFLQYMTGQLPSPALRTIMLAGNVQGGPFAAAMDVFIKVANRHVGFSHKDYTKSISKLRTQSHADGGSSGSNGRPVVFAPIGRCVNHSDSIVARFCGERPEVQVPLPSGFVPLQLGQQSFERNGLEVVDWPGTEGQIVVLELLRHCLIIFSGAMHCTNGTFNSWSAKKLTRVSFAGTQEAGAAIAAELHKIAGGRKNLKDNWKVMNRLKTTVSEGNVFVPPLRIRLSRVFEVEATDPMCAVEVGWDSIASPALRLCQVAMLEGIIGLYQPLKNFTEGPDQSRYQLILFPRCKPEAVALYFRVHYNILGVMCLNLVSSLYDCLDVLHPHCTVAHALPACIRSHGRVGKQNEQQLENLFHPLQRVSGRFAGTDLPFAMQMYSVLVAAFNSNYSPNYAKNQKRNASSDKVLKLLNGYQPLAPVLPMELLHDTSRVSQKLRNITSILQAHKDSGNIGGGVFDDMILFYPSDADEATIANLVAIGKQARKVAAQWTAAPQQLSLDWKAHTVKLDQHHISLALLLCLADTTTKDAMWKALTNPPTCSCRQTTV